MFEVDRYMQQSLTPGLKMHASE